MTRSVRWQKIVLASLSLTVFATGCQSLRRDRAMLDAADRLAAEVDAEPGVVQASGETEVIETAKKSSNRVVSFITGKEPQNPSRAKELYQEGDAAFRLAATLPREEAIEKYEAAAKLFRRAGEAAPKTAIQQDAMFMEAESWFFCDHLTDAVKVYERLQKEFPRNRHNDRVAARLFSISRYWIETAKVKEDSWLPSINLTDAKRPALDVDGHAIRVLDQIRYDDPTGRLADDATMAAAAEYIRQEKFEQADEFLTDLREAFPDSDHLFLAHLLGIRCKLNVYAGPRYSGLVLDEADKLVQQTRTRFPDKLTEPKYREMVARAAAEISFHRAEHLMGRASYREKRREYRAAQYYYQQILDEHAETPFAATARERLTATEQLKPVPAQPLAWLTKVFPDSRRSTPFEIKGAADAAPDEGGDDVRSEETMLR